MGGAFTVLGVEGLQGLIIQAFMNLGPGVASGGLRDRALVSSFTRSRSHRIHYVRLCLESIVSFGFDTFWSGVVPTIQGLTRFCR